MVFTSIPLIALIKLFTIFVEPIPFPGFPDDLQEVVHPHWASFPPQDPIVIDTLAVIYLLLWIVSFCGSSFVIYVFFVSEELKTPVSQTYQFNHTMDIVPIHFAV